MKIEFKPFDAIDRILEGIADAQDKAAKITLLRREASKLSSMANKRVKRLEANDLTDSPAYQKYLEGGKFGVKGKSHNELQAEIARLRRFINSESSTVRGTSKILKEMAENTGIKYKNLKDLKKKSKKFFELSSKVEQYLRTVDDMASAIGYQKIWEAINEYTKNAEIDLEGSEESIDSMVEAVTEAIKEYDEPVRMVNSWFTLKEK